MSEMRWWEEFIRKHFMGTDENTWWGHGVQGFVAGIVGYFWAWTDALLLLAGAFGHREISNLASPVLRGKVGWKESWEKFKDDGMGDLISPWVGFVTGLIFTALLVERVIPLIFG